MIDWREALICGRRFVVFAAVIAAFVAIITLATAAHARWKPQYASQPLSVQQWFSAQHNKQGQWCCDQADGHPYYGAYSFNKDGSVTLDLGSGKTHTLPAYMVLSGPNPTGHAVWWHGYGQDYCFAPGTMM